MILTGYISSSDLPTYISTMQHFEVLSFSNGNVEYTNRPYDCHKVCHQNSTSNVKHFQVSYVEHTGVFFLGL